MGVMTSIANCKLISSVFLGIMEGLQNSVKHQRGITTYVVYITTLTLLFD